MASRNITDLVPDMQVKAEAFLAECHRIGLDVLIYCTFRPMNEQADLYAQGRTAPGRIVTNAQPGQSAHNYAMAFDGCPLIGGKPAWNEPLDGTHWQDYGGAARSVGLEWGGDWVSFREGPHCQLPDWKTRAGVS